MKTSLRLMICSRKGVRRLQKMKEILSAHVFVLDVLEQLKLAISPLCEDGSAEWLHDLLDRRRRPCKLVLRRTTPHLWSAPPSATPCHYRRHTRQVRRRLEGIKRRENGSSRAIARDKRLTHPNRLKVNIARRDLDPQKGSFSAIAGDEGRRKRESDWPRRRYRRC